MDEIDLLKSVCIVSVVNKQVFVFNQVDFNGLEAEGIKE